MASHGSGLHACTICGTSYARLKDLSRHMANLNGLCRPVKVEKEDVDPINSADVARGEPPIDVSVGIVVKSEPIEQGDVCDEECRKPFEEPKPESIEADELIIKDEPDYFDHGATCDEIAEESTFDNSDSYDVKPVPSVSEPKKTRPYKPRGKKPRQECEHCGQTFGYQYRLAMHRVKAHGSTETPVASKPIRSGKLPRNFHCDECDRSYHIKDNLTIHKASVHGAEEKKYEKLKKHICKHCKKHLASWTNLVHHRKFVHGESIDKLQFVRCPSCLTKFAAEDEMEGHFCHRTMPVPNDERRYKCDLCGKGYITMQGMEHHYSVHPEYHNFKCDECPKGFFNVGELNRHKTIEHSEKFACGECNQLFKTPKSLKTHQELHTDAEYSCEHCGKKFKSRRVLLVHVSMTHTNRDAHTFRCDICNKTLIGKGHFQMHMRVHDNDRRYKCSIPGCDKTFVTSTNLKTHEQTHTRDYKFKCKFCEYGAVVRRNVLLHEQRKHNYNRDVGEDNSS